MRDHGLQPGRAELADEGMSWEIGEPGVECSAGHKPGVVTGMAPARGPTVCGQSKQAQLSMSVLDGCLRKPDGGASSL